MQTSQFDTIVQTLRDEEAELLSKQQKLTKQRTEVEQALTKVRGAMKSLGSKGSGKGNARTYQKPAATQEEVLKAVTSILRKRGPLQHDALTALVSQVITKAGRSRLGLTLRLKETLSQPQFRQTPDGYQLTKEGAEQ